MWAPEVVPSERPSTTPAAPHQHQLRPNPYIVGYSGYIPGLMFQYGRTFAKAAEDCVVTFLRQQEEKVCNRHVELTRQERRVEEQIIVINKEERRCKSLPRMRSVRTEETEKIKQKFTYAFEENYPPLPGYTGHIHKVSRSSVVGRSVASATRRVREKAMAEQKTKEKSQSVERYQEQTASSRAKQVRHVRTQHHVSSATSRTQTSSVSRVVHPDDELTSRVDPDLEPESDHPHECEPEDVMPGSGPTSTREILAEPQEDAPVDVVQEAEGDVPAPKETAFEMDVGRDDVEEVRRKPAVDNVELAGQIKCDDCGDRSQPSQLAEVLRPLDDVDTKANQVSSDYYRSAVSVKESFYQSVIARTTRYESPPAIKKKETKKSPSPSKDRKSFSPKKSAEPKTNAETSPKKSSSQVAPKTSPKKADSKTTAQTSPKKSDSQAVPKTSPKKIDSKATTQTSPKKLDSKPTTQTSPKKPDPKSSPSKVNVPAKLKPEPTASQKSSSTKTTTTKKFSSQQQTDIKTKASAKTTQASEHPKDNETSDAEITKAPEDQAVLESTREPLTKPGDTAVKSAGVAAAASKGAHKSPAFESRLADPVKREGHVI